MLYGVDSQVFEKFPGFRRIVVVARNLDNSGESPELALLLKEREAAVRSGDLENFKEHPSLAAWIKTFAALGINPNKFPPSIVNLVKRVRSGKDLPYINSLVAAFNCISLKYLLPCGGDDLAAVTGDLRLGLAAGTEIYVPLGRPDEREHPKAGEIIYFDTGNQEVFCRAWCWKNGDRSKLTAATRRAAVNVDVMAPVGLELAERAAAELAALLERFTGATTSLHWLTPETPEFTF